MVVQGGGGRRWTTCRQERTDERDGALDDKCASTANPMIEWRRLSLTSGLTAMSETKRPFAITRASNLVVFHFRLGRRVCAFAGGIGYLNLD